MRIFIHGVDTYVGKVLSRELRKTEGGFHRVFGTVRGSNEDAPKFVKRICSREDPKRIKKFMETLASCKVVVIDVFNYTLEDLKFIISALKVDPESNPPKATGELDKDVIFILVSSIVVWGNTPPPEPPPPEPVEVVEQGEEGNAAEANAEEAGEANPDAAEGEEGEVAKEQAPSQEPVEVEEKPPPIIPLTDADYQRRVPLEGERYAEWKEMEDLVMRCFNREESRVKGYVVAGGVLYGAGENRLGQLFKDAWLGLDRHRIMPTGSNRVPMVHIRDLARLVREVGFSEAPPDPMTRPYFIAVDQPPAEPITGLPSLPLTQQQVVQGIIDEVSGKHQAPILTEDQDLRYFYEEDGHKEEAEGGERAVLELREAMSMDLIVAPSDLMLDPETFAAQLNPPGWLFRDGIVANMRTVAEQFCEERKLQTMRILISGPPASGKSRLAEQIAEHFNIPHLEMSPDSLDNTWAKLQEKVCRYRGYVLDSRLSGHADCDQLFCEDYELLPVEGEEEEEPPPPAEGEGDENGEPTPPKKKIGRRLNKELSPTYVIVLQAPEAFCRARWNAAGRGSVETFQSEASQYAIANLGLIAGEDDASQDVRTEEQLCLTDFFQETAEIGVFNLPVPGKDPEDVFECARIYIENAGRPFNYLKSEEEVIEQIIVDRAEKEEKGANREAADLERLEREARELAERQEEAKREARRLGIVDDFERQREAIQAMPTRDYLMKNMVPCLTEGLIEVCKVLPENPVDYLASYLEQHAADDAT